MVNFMAGMTCIQRQFIFYVNNDYYKMNDMVTSSARAAILTLHNNTRDLILLLIPLVSGMLYFTHSNKTYTTDNLATYSTDLHLTHECLNVLIELSVYPIISVQGSVTS